MPKPFRTLVACFDGTWNDSHSNTNVGRLYAQVADVSTGCASQRKFYDAGVGTRNLEKIRGGAFGFGLDRNIRMGYAWLASVYESRGPGAPAAAVVEGRRANGDLLATAPHSSGAQFLEGSDIYLFGFSRGAFTARSLGGMINYLGLPRIDPGESNVDDPKLAGLPLVEEAWELYSTRPTPEERKAKDARVAPHDAKVQAFREKNRYPVRLHFLGVWDTVGSLGIPRVFDKDWLPRSSTRFQFHDTTLGECIRNAFHACAIDEHRLPFSATLWTGPKKPAIEDVEQRWFPGSHADVGGGYDEDLLHEPPLAWLSQMAAAHGLEFLNDRGPQPPAVAVPPAAFELDGTECLSPVHDSYAEFMRGAYRIVRSVPGMGGRVYRRMLVAADGINQTIDPTAFRKWQLDREYRPPNLGQAGRADVTFNLAGAESYGAVRAGG
jgi:hypothetical protein